MNGFCLVFCTFPDAASARQIGTVLIEKQLAACVNLIPGVESVYRWQGKVESASEVLAIFKTSVAVFPTFERELANLHPYEVPEIIAVEPAAVAESYGSWLLGSLVSPDRHGS
jgi:periplasmic divalent cation tolerance protein